MNGREIDQLGLNMGADISVTLKNFHYRFEDGSKIVDVSFDKKPKEEGWTRVETIIGMYCGDRHDANTQEMTVFKVRVSEPFIMDKMQGNYIKVSPGDIVSMEVIRNGPATVLDKLSHALSVVGGVSPEN